MPNVSCSTFHHRRQAVGGAGSVGNDVVLGGVVEFVVDAQHDGDVFVLGGRRNDDFLHRALNVLLGIVRVGELAGRFDDYLRSERTPVDRRGILGREHLDLLAVHGNEILTSLHVVGQRAQHGVVLEQVRQRLGVGQIVSCHDLDIGIADLTPDTPPKRQTVNRDFNCHRPEFSFSFGMWLELYPLVPLP